MLVTTLIHHAATMKWRDKTMKIYRKVTMYVSQDVPDNLTDKGQEEAIEAFDNNISLAMDSLDDGGYAPYKYEWEVENKTREELEEENKELIDWLEREG